MKPAKRAPFLLICLCIGLSLSACAVEESTDETSDDTWEQIASGEAAAEAGGGDATAGASDGSATSSPADEWVSTADSSDGAGGDGSSQASSEEAALQAAAEANESAAAAQLQAAQQSASSDQATETTDSSGSSSSDVQTEAASSSSSDDSDEDSTSLTWLVGLDQRPGRGVIGRAGGGRGFAPVGLSDVRCAPGQSIVSVEATQVLWNGVSVLGGIAIRCAGTIPEGRSFARFTGVGVPTRVVVQDCGTSGATSPGIDSGIGVTGFSWMVGDAVKDGALICSDVRSNAEGDDLETASPVRLPGWMGVGKTARDRFVATSCPKDSVAVGLRVAATPVDASHPVSAIVGVQILCSDLALQ